MNRINWLGDRPMPEDGARLQVKIRSTHAPMGATAYPDEADRALVVFDRPQAGVAPGQACVFYDGERVLGGGWIRRPGGSA